MKKQIILILIITVALGIATKFIRDKKQHLILTIKDSLTRINEMELTDSIMITKFYKKHAYPVMLGLNPKDNSKYEFDLPGSSGNYFEPGKKLTVKYFQPNDQTDDKCITSVSANGEIVLIFEYTNFDIELLPYSFCKSWLIHSNEKIKSIDHSYCLLK
jgi:hypothetical protein